MNKKILSLVFVIAMACALVLAFASAGAAAGTVKLTVEITPKTLPAAGSVSVNAVLENNTSSAITDVAITFPGNEPVSVGNIESGGAANHSDAAWAVSDAMLNTPLDFVASFKDSQGRERTVIATATIEQTGSGGGTAGVEATSSVEKDVIESGEKIKFTFTITNTGGVTLENISLKAPPLNDGNQLGETFSLAPGEQRVMTWSPVLSEGITVQPVFTYTADGTESTIDAGAVSVRLEGEEAPADSAAEQTAALGVHAAAEQTTADAGDTIAFTLTIINPGSVVISGLNVTDAAGNITNVDLSDTAAPAGGTVSGTAFVQVNDSQDVVFTVTGTAEGTGETVTAQSDPIAITVDGGSGGEVASDAIGMEIMIPTLTMSKPGPMDFTFTVYNHTGGEIRNVLISEAQMGVIATIPSMPETEQTLTQTLQIDESASLVFSLSAALPDGSEVHSETDAVAITVENADAGMGLDTMLILLIVIIGAIIAVVVILLILVHKNKKAARAGASARPAARGGSSAQKERGASSNRAKRPAPQKPAAARGDTGKQPGPKQQRQPLAAPKPAAKPAAKKTAKPQRGYGDRNKF